MLLSYIVYFGLLIECWIFSYFAEKRNRKLLIWVIILSLTMAAGLRAYSVGLDTPSYVEKFSYICIRLRQRVSNRLVHDL